MPAQQKVLLLPKKQGDGGIGTVQIPKPGPGQLLVKVKATALNHMVWKIQAYGIVIQKFPAILGFDAAGTVEEVGKGVSDFALGDKQYALANADITAKIPGNITVDQVATVPLGLATATPALFDGGSAGLSPPWEEDGRDKYIGKAFVVFSSASSVGQYAIQLAKLSGFSPIIATASLKNSSLLKSLGITHVLNRKSSSDALTSEVSKIATGTPVEVIYDAVSLPTMLDPALDILTPGGTLVLVKPDPVDEAKKAATQGKRAVGVFGDVNAPDRKRTGQRLYAKLPALLESGAIKPNRVELLPDGLASIPGSLKRMQKGEASAFKFVARPQETP
ncbi:GroES-like protein [Obba rivulosa]|uniref:GroES-like protein n=1 Tax=Obba rivulosa TaxID=1052685 RepID=A0A8E2B1W0_9APHY|nr:GroES-like protein [Obba rivulosa]